MAGKASRRNAVPVSDLATALLDPILRKRAGLSVALVQCWDEIAGVRIAALSRPERIVWGRRTADDGPYEPAVLVIACEGLAALHIQHETTEIIARANAFLGFGAIGRIRIVQKPVHKPEPPKPKLRALTGEETDRVERAVAGIDDDKLRQALAQLGASVLASQRRPL